MSGDGLNRKCNGVHEEVGMNIGNSWIQEIRSAKREKDSAIRNEWEWKDNEEKNLRK